MDKTSFILLWDNYRGILTPTQREICDLYFNLDLTLSEIADEKGISRQGVSECLKTCKRQLEEYEEKLGFCRRLQEICLQESFLLTEARRWAEEFKSANPHYADEAEKLLTILDKDYYKEAEAALKNPETAEILNRDYTAQVFKTSKTGEE